MSREPKFRGVFAFVIEKPGNNAECYKETKEDDVPKVGKDAGACEAGDEKKRRTKKKKVHKGNAGDKRRGEGLGFFANVFAKRGMIEQKQSSERELKRSRNETAKNDYTERNGDLHILSLYHKRHKKVSRICLKSKSLAW